jgi:hypothetical protein
MVELIEVEPGKWRVKREPLKHQRSALPLPYVISDTMNPVEQVDGKFYTSKRQYQAVGKAHGLIEVGNDTARFHVKQQHASASRTETEKRVRAVKKAVEKFKSR